MRSSIAVVLTLLATPAFAAAPIKVTFPNLPQALTVKAGRSVHFQVPPDQLGKLQPIGGQYEGIPLFNASLQYRVDSDPVQDLVVATPHSTGTGGYDGTSGPKSIALKVPKTANQIQYWFKSTKLAAQPSDPTLYYSNYGNNFRLDVTH